MSVMRELLKAGVDVLDLDEVVAYGIGQKERGPRETVGLTSLISTRGVGAPPGKDAL